MPGQQFQITVGKENQTVVNIDIPDGVTPPPCVRQAKTRENRVCMLFSLANQTIRNPMQLARLKAGGSAVYSKISCPNCVSNGGTIFEHVSISLPR